jgi:hypothetical protein
MNDLISRRKLIGCLMAGCIAPLVSACGGGENGSSGAAVDSAEVNAQTKSTVSTTAFSVTSPAQNASATSTFTMSGTAGTQWVNVAIYSGSTKLSADVTPSGGKWSTTVNMGTLTGTQTLTVMAFSVVAGKAGGTSTSAALSVMISATTSTGIPFFGVCGHYANGQFGTTSQYVKDATGIGLKVTRLDGYSTSDMTAIANQISAYAPMVIQPIFGQYPSSSSTETAAYNQFYALGVAGANLFAGKVPMVELMNEPDNQYFPNGSAANNGQAITDWKAANSYWPAFRGACRGFIAGFRSIDPNKTTLIASPSVSWLHYGILDGLWFGTAPDGTTGHPTVAWDVTNFHWYYDDGNIENVANTNVLQYFKTAYGVPITMSEIGVQVSLSESAVDSYIATIIAFYSANKAKYNITNVCWFELYNNQNDGGFYMGLYSTGGTKNAGRADAIKAAVAAAGVQ